MPPPTRFGCVLVGESAMVAACTELLLERGHRVRGVVSPDPEIRTWAERTGLASTGFGPELVPWLTAQPFDHLFSVVNLRLLPSEVLALPQGLAVNFHDGPLPRHAGRYATTWAILEGERMHGVSWHLMTDQADRGDVLVSREVPVAAAETSATLNLKCLAAGIDTFGELVQALEQGTVRRRAQDPAGRSYHGRFDRPPGAGFLCWDRPAGQLAAAVRAADFGPHPNGFGTAKALLGGEAVVVRELTPLSKPTRAVCGTVLAVGPDAGSEEGTDAAAEGTVTLTVVADGRPVRLSGLHTVHGEPLTAAELSARGVRPGSRLTPAERRILAAAERAEAASLRAEPFWLRRLAGLDPADLPFRAPGPVTPTVVPVPPRLSGAEDERRTWLLTALLAFLVRLGAAPGTDVRLRLRGPGTGHPVVDALYADWIPLRLPQLGVRSDTELHAETTNLLRAAHERGPFPYDLWLRCPQLRGRLPRLPIALEFADDGPLELPVGSSLLIRVGTDRCVWLGADEALAGYAAAFLRELTALAQARPAELPLGTEEIRRSAARWNETATDVPPDTGVHRLIARQARLRADAPSVICGEQSVTYGDLDRRSSELAGRLRSRGAGPGRRVGVYLARTPELVVALLAVLKSGAAYVPLDPLYPPARIAGMIEDAAPVLLVTDPGLAPGLPATGVELVVAQPPRPADDEGGTPEGGTPEDGTPEDGASVPGDSDAYVIYTSGSTGRPKGVRITHRSLTNLVCAMAVNPGFTSRDRLLAVTTVCFDIAALELFVPLATGGQVELAPDEVAADGFQLRELLERSRPTVLQATPATWRMLLEAGWPGQPLRMLCGGEALPADLAEKLLRRGDGLWNLYGPTETTIWSSVTRVQPGERPLLGPPIANTTFHVLDADQRPLPPGVAGELYIGGDGVAAGYLGRPELTAERFVQVPHVPYRLYRTGDLVRQLTDGRLAYLGRADHQFKLHGYRIEPAEIEAALRDHPSVSEAVAVLREERLVAYLVPHGTPAPAGQLRAHLATAGLPDYLIPSAFVALDRIPRTANGKTDRAALPSPSAPAVAAPDRADRTERAIAEVWQQVLGLDRVGLDDNFFEVGGTSLLLMRVMARLRTQVLLPLTRVEMFAYPTVRSLARRLAPPAAPRPAPEAPRPAATRSVLGELRRRRGR
ncbi:amino acid adenylation domain-containing protein [Streptomyces cellostaticus]|uniref:amino acid adenylation domain-containing protein n=1 Tax=Streptomyces cellostaticus TaxID=67285 RepID=UPI001ABFDFD5|nr:amino acid adenylation domain-containing protein [Streptomyces cellostaticus]